MTQPPRPVPGRLLRLRHPDPPGQTLSLPYSHPDSWALQPYGTPPPVAEYDGQMTIGGRPHLLFRDREGWLWAQPLLARRWDEPLQGVRSNQPVDQPHQGPETHTLLPETSWEKPDTQGG